MRARDTKTFHKHLTINTKFFLLLRNYKVGNTLLKRTKHLVANLKTSLQT